MLWTRWNPLGTGMLSRFQQLQEEMNRVFDRWGDGRTAFPALNVWEQDDALFVEAELPGLGLEDLEIFVTGQNQLTIKGERKPAAPDNAMQHRLERPFGQFVRTLTLPFPVDDSAVDARLENGVLTLRLPKHEAAKPRKIKVKG